MHYIAAASVAHRNSTQEWKGMTDIMDTCWWCSENRSGTVMQGTDAMPLPGQL